jgi:hypothetical protein
MAYNKEKEQEDYKTRSNIQGIVNKKSEWQSAYDKGDKEGMSAAAKGAKEYYDSLTSSGRYDVAQKLSGTGYEDAKKYLNSFSGTQRTTDEMRKDQEEQNGKYLDKAENLLDEQTDFTRDAKARIYSTDDKQEKRIDTNPYDTAAAKKILSRYSSLGENAKDDTYASGTLRNEGNMDSFTAANAAKQQQAYEQAADQSVLDYYDKWTTKGEDHANNVANHISTLWDEYNGNTSQALNVAKTGQEDAESKTNNRNSRIAADVAKAKEYADETGYVSNYMLRDNNPYFDSDGNLKNPDTDFQAIINEREAAGDIDGANEARFAREYKIKTTPGYEQYAGTGTSASKVKTSAEKTADVNRLATEASVTGVYDTGEVGNPFIDENGNMDYSRDYMAIANSAKERGDEQMYNWAMYCRNKKINDLGLTEYTGSEVSTYQASTADIQKENINADASRDVAQIGADADVNVAQIGANADVDVAKIGAGADVSVAQINAAAKNGGSSSGKNSGSSGSGSSGKNSGSSGSGSLSSSGSGNTTSSGGLDANKRNTIKNIRATYTGEKRNQALADNGITPDEYSQYLNENGLNY